MIIPIELKLLVAAMAVGFVQLNLAALAARRQQSFQWGAGPRDEPRPLTGVAARLERAHANFMETFPYFATAIVAAASAHKLGPLTLWGSAFYVGARILYVPLYAAGIPYLRTLIWHVAVVGAIMVVGALLG